MNGRLHNPPASSLPDLVDDGVQAIDLLLQFRAFGNADKN